MIYIQWCHKSYVKFPKIHQCFFAPHPWGQKSDVFKGHMVQIFMKFFRENFIFLVTFWYLSEWSYGSIFKNPILVHFKSCRYTPRPLDVLSNIRLFLVYLTSFHGLHNIISQHNGKYKIVTITHLLFDISAADRSIWSRHIDPISPSRHRGSKVSNKISKLRFCGNHLISNTYQGNR